MHFMQFVHLKMHKCSHVRGTDYSHNIATCYHFQELEIGKGLV